MERNDSFPGFVTTLAGSSPPSAYWIGASLLIAPRWTWTTNDTASYTNWAADQPADPSSFECASVGTDNTNLWRKELCYSSRPFVCNAPPSSGDDSSPCDPGYTLYENQCFGLFKNFITRMDYHDAKLFCRDHQNATLPKITLAGMQDFLHGFIFDSGSNIWLGLTCRGPDVGDCTWWDGTVPTYTYFASGSPNSWPIGMLVANGQWYKEVQFWQLMTVVVCQKPARST